MAEPQRRLMSVEEFFAWQLDQTSATSSSTACRAAPSMTGASNVHDAIVVNIIALLWSQLHGGPCRVATADTARRTAIGRCVGLM
jgi:Uma2 family endonuclease